MRIPIITKWLARRELEDSALAMVMNSHVQLQDDVKYLGDQVNELVVLNRRRERLVVAAQHFAQVFDDPGLAYDEGDRLNDQQMCALTAVLRSAGHGGAADTWESHQVPDNADDDEDEAEAAEVTTA